jgi:hypothetical protein
MRWLIIGIAVLTFAIAGAGCGGGDDEASATDETTITDTTTDDTTDETTTEEETDTDGDGAFSSGECSELVAASAAISQAFAAQGQGDLGEVEELFDRFADQVPEELQDDVQVLSDAYSDYLAALADAGLEPGETPTAEEAGQLVQALSAIDAQAVQEAGEELTAWANANCPSG